MAINTVTLVGRFVREPEIRHTTQGTSVASFTLAVDNGRDREASFIDCTAWKGTADFIESWMHKGTKVAVSGRLATRDWEDRNGNKRKSTEVVVGNIEFAESKQDRVSQPAEATKGYDPLDRFEDYDDDDVPF